MGEGVAEVAAEGVRRVPQLHDSQRHGEISELGWKCEGTACCLDAVGVARRAPHAAVAAYAIPPSSSSSSCCAAHPGKRRRRAVNFTTPVDPF